LNAGKKLKALIQVKFCYAPISVLPCASVSQGASQAFLKRLHFLVSAGGWLARRLRSN
jgi:hypothetical protein